MLAKGIYQSLCPIQSTLHHAKMFTEVKNKSDFYILNVQTIFRFLWNNSVLIKYHKNKNFLDVN